MSAYKSQARGIKDALVTLLSGVQLDAGHGAEPAFGLVTDDPSMTFTGNEPFVMVYPAPSNDTKAAIGQNDREVAFIVIVVLSMENKQRTQVQTYDYMYDLTELILDCFDEGDFTDALNRTDTTLHTWIMNATRSTFLPAEAKAGAILLCNIDVAVTYSKDL